MHLVIPSEVEESRGLTEKQIRGILRLRCASLRMTAAREQIASRLNRELIDATSKLFRLHFNQR